MRFEGKKIVVIGGSSGMGLATARAAAVEGARVIIASRSEEKADCAASTGGISPFPNPQADFPQSVAGAGKDSFGG